MSTSTPTAAVTADRYPTRIVAETRPDPIERAEPAVWRGASGGPATAEELRSHGKKGFHVTDALLSDTEVAAFREEFTALTNDPKARADERTVVEKESDEVRSIFEAHVTSERVAALVRDPRVLDRARQILGSDVYVHQSRINYMPGFRGKGFYWHSDFETWHAEDGMPGMRCVSLSVALTDNYPYNGGLMLMPGAHRTFVPCLGATPEGYHKESLKEQRIGVPSEADITMLADRHGIEQFTGRAGSALWFDCNSMHGSGSNITPFPRSNVFIVFNSVENAPVAPFSAKEPRPGYIAERDTAPVTR